LHLNDVPFQFVRVKNTFIDVPQNSSGSRALRRVHTEGDVPEPAPAKRAPDENGQVPDVHMASQDSAQHGAEFFSTFPMGGLRVMEHRMEGFRLREVAAVFIVRFRAVRREILCEPPGGKVYKA
jgi:hypothetical protein